jgi:4-amino-4-deoxy-L-arabinose transferase-like glycosyltransferase
LSVADRSARWLWSLRPVAGFVWMVLLVLPWFVAIVAKSGGDFFVQAVGHDMLGKVTSGQEAHGAPPGFYFVLFWVTFWPGSVLAGLAAPMIWRSRREAGAQFLLAWLVPSWLVFEAVMTKLPHYVLPLYPAITILIAGILESRNLSKSRWLVRGTIGWFLFPGAIAIAVLIAFIMFGGDLGLIAWPFSAAAVICGLFAWWLYDVDGAERALLRFPECDDRRSYRHDRVPAATRCLDICLSGAQPGVFAGQRYALHGRGGCRRLPARRPLQFRGG